MKKILLLSALFGGFVLNNGYCYDENQETLREIGIHVLNCKVQTYNIKGKISKLLSRHKLIPAISDTLISYGFDGVKIDTKNNIITLNKNNSFITVQKDTESTYKVSGYGTEVNISNDDLSKNNIKNN